MAISSVAKVAILQVDEPVHLERHHIDALYGQLGGADAGNVVGRAMAELSARLRELAVLREQDRLDDLARRARSMIAIAEQIGMTGLARVANDVCDCAVQGDPAALAATLARLQRIGNLSLTAIWKLRDHSL